MVLPQQRRCAKFFSAALAATFFFTQVAFAHLPQQTLWDARKNAAASSKPSVQLARLLDAKLPAPAKPAFLSAVLSEKLSAVRPNVPSSDFLKDVPLDAVTVRDVVPAGAAGPLAGRRIVIVQDVHLNRESQTNVAKLLFSLMDARRAGLVAVEGAEGAFDFQRFRRFPDAQVTRDVAQAFFDSDRMGGPSFAGLTTPSTPPAFIGIDDAAHYDANVQAYRGGAAAKPAVQAALVAEERELTVQKKSFPAALASLDAAATAFDRGERGLGDHLQLLEAVGALSLLNTAQAETAHRFLDAWRLEKNLDFARADAERRTALEKLVEKLDAREMEGIVSLSLAYRKGGVSYGDYHRQISSLFDRHGVSLSKYPAFQSYLRYVALSDGINGDRLLDATRRATELALARLASTPEQRALLSVSRRHELKRKLIAFSLTPREWTEYAAGGLTPAFAPFENFYREAHARSEKMVANFQEAVQGTDSSKLSVLVIGGFHAPEMAERLKALGAGYALVSPRLTKVDLANGSAYLSIFSREKTPLDRLFEGERLFLYPAQTDVAANGPYTDGPNREFRVLQLLAQALRSAAGVVTVQVDGRTYRAVGNGAKIPFGYAAVGEETVGRERIRLIAPTRWRAGLTTLGSPLRALSGIWDRLVGTGRLTRDWAARLSFAEELALGGIVLFALPWILVVVGAVPSDALSFLRPALALVVAAISSSSHDTVWRVDGDRLRSRPATSGDRARLFALSLAFNVGFLIPGFNGAAALAISLAAHAAWNNVVAPLSSAIPLAMMSREKSWWQNGDKTYVAMSVPLYALRRDPATDPGIGKFTDLGPTFRNQLKPQGVGVVLLLPHYATIDESPYAPVSLFAVQERNIDWSQVPEVAHDASLMASLVAPRDGQNTVDYAALDARENAVATEALKRFQKSIQTDTERSQSYRLFLRQNRGWLREYADFMAVRRILNKPPLDWNDSDVSAARASASYQELYDLHSFKQWIGYRQFADALEDVQRAGGKVLIDIPMFRGKDSVSIRNHPQYFRDPKNRSAGIRNAWTDQTWGDLALWNWHALRQESFDFILGPIRHWLRFGVDGARNDATHFYYPIGQFGDGDEPGDAMVSRLASTFQQYNALPVAEAFENKGDEVARHGIVVIDGNWQRVSTHDDHNRPHVNDPVNFMKDLLGRVNRRGDPRTAQFIGFTLGDLEGETAPVKTMEDGRSLWRYRLPLVPQKDLGRIVHFYTDTLPKLRAGGQSIWDASDDVRAMFEAAAESFIKIRDGRPEIWAASRDWFAEQWGRDTFIALPGLLLSTRRFDVAREVIRSFARFERNGLVPNRIWDPANLDSVEYNTSDGSMWFIQSIQSYVEATGDWDFVMEMAPVMRRIMQGYMHGTGWDAGKHINANASLNDRRIQMDASDGLISVPAQSTWMDADPHAQGPVTPRDGKPVEINALWYANLKFMDAVLARQGTESAGEKTQYEALAAKVKESFNRTFWNDHAINGGGERENTLFDMAPGGPHNGAVRPNMLIAVSHGGDLLSPERQAMVLARAEKDLWTPMGPRTLSPRDSNYKARYETNRQPYPGEPDFPNHKDYAYHQGTVWPWLIGTYVDALVKVRRGQGKPMFQIQEELRALLDPIVNEFVNQGSLPEVYDGSPRMEDGRQHPGGTSSQAWSVGEVYRVLEKYGVLRKQTSPEASDADVIAKLRVIARNYQKKFRQTARAMVAALTATGRGEWTGDERSAAIDLIQDAEDAFDWRRGWAAQSKHYPQFRGHPIFLMSMEARTSASQTARTRAEYEEFRRNNFDRLTTNQGGLGDLAGGWNFGGLADMGMVTTMNPSSEAPEAYVFLPNYRQGVRLSKVDEFGWPISDSQNEAWSASRPQDVGIPLIKDPVNTDQPLTVTVPVHGIGEVKVNFRAVEKDGLKLILMETDDNEGKGAEIFNRMYQGSLSSEERFRQQWVFGVAAQKFKERFGLADGPLHLNETATFVTMLARIRDHMERLVKEGVPYETAYEIALEEVGQELIFFTHTLVEAGVDRFFANISVGDYIRELFEESPVLKQKEAWDATKWLIEGKDSRVHGGRLPGFWFDRKGEPHYSPLNFVTNLAYKFNGEVVAVSRLNAKKAGEFLVGARILTPEQVEAKPVNAETNATDELFFLDEREVKVMGLEAAEPSERHPERILDPSDPQARELYRIATGGKELPADFRKPAISNADLKAIKDDNRAKMVQRVRWGMHEQYIRNITDLTEALKDQGLSGPERGKITVRLAALKKRWESWTGQPFPARVEEMKKQELVNLLDPKALTAVWSRRIVEYKRMLFTVFGENLPLVEKLVKDMPASREGIDQLLDAVMADSGATSLEQLVQPFLDRIEKDRTQFLFAGPTFDYKGRAMVAILDRVLERLGERHPAVINRAVYVEGYNDELSHYFVQGADIWLNTPKRPLEASGTSGMKADAVNLTVRDGWAADGGFNDLNILAIQPAAEEMPLDHPDEWTDAQKADSAKVKQYLREEAASLYAGLSRASQAFHNQQDSWWNLVRRSLYFKMTVYSVRSSFTGRYIPTSDPKTSAAGWETGIFELYDRTIRRMEAGRQRVSEEKRFGTLQRAVSFKTQKPTITLLDNSSEVEASIQLAVDPAALGDADIFIYFGLQGQPNWTAVRAGPSDIQVSNGVATVRLRLQPNATGLFGVTAFVTPKGVSNPNLRIWAAGLNGNAEFRRDQVGSQVKNSVAPLGLLGFWAGLPPMSVGRTSVLESILIFTGLLAALTSILVQGTALSGVPLDFFGLVVVTARVTLGIALAAFPLLVYAHLVFGVLEPAGRTAVFSGSLAVRAGAVASVTLIGLPLLVFGLLALSVQFPIMLIGYIPIIALGVALGGLAHRAVNKLVLGWISTTERISARPVALRSSNRQRIIESLGPVLDFLGEKSSTKIDQNIARLRTREISELPAANVVEDPLQSELPKIDAIVVLGSHYLYVPARAARIYMALVRENPKLAVVFAGGMGPRTLLNFPYWSSEAALFRDVFTSSVRAARRATIQRTLRQLSRVLGRFAPLITEIVLVMDDALLSYRGMMPKKILMDTASTNTGANVKNVQALFESNGIEPKNVMIITADVFQRRAVATWIQQYGLPMEKVYSVPASHESFSEMTNEELVELADEAALQIRRLEEYARPETKFTVPVRIPADVRASAERLTQILNDANLSGYASGHDHDRESIRNPFRSFIALLITGVLVTGAIALIPAGSPINMFSVSIASFVVMSEILLGAVAVVAVYSIIFSPNGIRVSDGMEPGPLRRVVRVLQALIPPAVGLTIALLPMMRVVEIPFYVTVIALFVLGTIVRSWGGVAARVRESSEETPGAAGLWAGSGTSLGAAGAWEGLAVAAVSASAMGLLFLLPLFIGDIHAPATAIWAGLTVVGIAASAASLNAVHRATGVTLVPGTEASRDPAVIAAAIRTSYLSLLGIPLLAAAFVLPLFPAILAVSAGLLLSIVPHAVKNVRAERARSPLSDDDRADAARVARMVADLRAARIRGDDAGTAAAIASLVNLERLDLDSFGQELARGSQRSKPLTLESDADVGAYAAWRFAVRSAARHLGGFSAGTLSSVIAETRNGAASADIRRVDSVGIVASGATAAEISAEVRATRTIAGERSIVVILTEAQSPLADALRAEFGGSVQFLLESDLDTAEDVRTRLLEPVLLKGGTLKMLLQSDAALPDFLMRSLMTLGQDQRYRNLVEFVLVAALSNGAFAVRATLGDLQKAMEYRDLVMSQA